MTLGSINFSINLMRITIVLAAISLTAVVLFSPCSKVFAQVSSSASKIATSSASLSNINLTVLAANLPDPGQVVIGKSQITADSALYFLKAIQERVELYLAKDRPAKTQKQLEFSQRRLREMISMLDRGSNGFVEPTMELYRSSTEAAIKLAGNDAVFKVSVAQTLARHQNVLVHLYNLTADYRSKMAILNSLEKVEEYNRQTIATLDLENQQKLIGQIALWQVQSCNFFAREASNGANSEATKQLLLKRVDDCKLSISTDLKDELEMLRKKKINNQQAQSALY